MPPVPPSPDDLARIAAGFGFELSEDEIEGLGVFAAAAMGAYARIDQLPDVQLPVRYPRTDLGYRPTGDDNPFNGWAWKCRIEGASAGPLAGRTVAIKDCISVAEIPMLNGSPIMEGFVPRQDATVVTRLLDAGGTIVGKTAVPAFCTDGTHVTGYPEPFPVNPHDPSRLPGASSSGSAVLVVSGEVDLALGGDQAGSIRLPSSWSGCCGLKPTYGLVPYTGIVPIELTLDHVGPMARTVADCALLLEAIAGPDGLDPRQVDVRVGRYSEALTEDLAGVRVGILAEGFGLAASEPDVDAAVRAAAESLAGQGASVEEVSVPMHRDAYAIWTAIAFEGASYQMFRGDLMGTNWRGHYLTELVEFYSRARRERAASLAPTSRMILLIGEYMTERYGHRYYAKAQNVSRTLRAAYDEALGRVDVLVLPTTAMKARERPTEWTTAAVLEAANPNLENTSAFDATGHPALSVPCAMSDGLPVGMMIVGRHFDEEMVLRVGHAFHDARIS